MRNSLTKPLVGALSLLVAVSACEQQPVMDPQVCLDRVHDYLLWADKLADEPR